MVASWGCLQAHECKDVDLKVQGLSVDASQKWGLGKQFYMPALIPF